MLENVYEDLNARKYIWRWASLTVTCICAHCQIGQLETAQTSLVFRIKRLSGSGFWRLWSSWYQWIGPLFACQVSVRVSLTQTHVQLGMTLVAVAAIQADIPNEIDLTQSIAMPCNASPFKCFIISLLSTTFTSVWPSFTKMSSPVKNSSPLLNHFELMSTTVLLSTDKQFFPRTRISENSIRISCLSVLCFQKRMNIEIYTILPEIIEICCWTDIFKTFYH